MTITTAENMEAQETLSPAQVKRGRRTALLLFAVGFGPMILATVMFYTGWLNPGGHTNQGDLINPPLQISSFSLKGAGGEPLEARFGPQAESAKWLLLVTATSCDQQCEELLYLARQVNIALGKNANRVNRAAWLGDVPAPLAGRWADEYSAMERLKQTAGASIPGGLGIESEPRILLVDPLGNVILRYNHEHTGKDMLKDLKHLLKLSQIG